MWFRSLTKYFINSISSAKEIHTLICQQWNDEILLYLQIYTFSNHFFNSKSGLFVLTCFSKATEIVGKNVPKINAF